MVNRLSGLTPHRAYHNQSPGESVPLESCSHSGKPWAETNIGVGEESSNCLEIACLTDIVTNYFESFFDPENNKFMSLAVKALKACRGYLEGKRDKDMYQKIYSKGIDEVVSGKLTNEQILNQEDLPDKNFFKDDFLENMLLNVHYGEKWIPRFWKWATECAKLKPTVSLISGFLNDRISTIIYTIMETPARMLWRIRFFPGALHANFITTIVDIARLKMMSLLGNRKASEELKEKTKEVHELSYAYFTNKYKGTRKPDKKDIDLYFAMLGDRMKEHWNGILHPKEALKRKLNDGFLKPTTLVERQELEHRTIGNGYAILEDKADIDHQRISSIADFTGPICGGLGLIGTTLFDPLKAIWAGFNIEKGKSVIDALSASRKSFSLFNYIFRFIKAEITEGRKYTALENAVKSNAGGARANNALREFYYAMRARYVNGIVGMLVAVGNILEPVFHLLKPKLELGRFGNLLFNVYTRSLNDNGLVWIFSQRRQCLGMIERINLMARDKLSTDRQIVKEDYQKISDLEVDRAMEDIYSQKDGLGLIDPHLSKVIGLYDRVKKAFTGNFEGIYPKVKTV